MQGGKEGGTLRATSTACVLLTMPTTTEPCFTASEAYSTWKMRPWGELEGVNGDCNSRRRWSSYKVTESLS